MYYGERAEGVDVIQLSGPFGRFQKKYAINVMGVIWFFCGATTILMIFVAQEPPRYPGCGPNFLHGACHAPNVPLRDDDCVTPYTYLHPTVSVVSEFKAIPLKCADGIWSIFSGAASAQSAFFAGFLVGVFLLGRLGDAAGRWVAAVTSVFLMEVASLLSAFSGSLFQFGLFRALTGAGVGGSGLQTFLVLSEITGEAYRHWLAIFHAGAFAFGASSVCLLSALIPSWRILALCVAVSGLACLWVPYTAWAIESPRWLAARGYGDRALAAWGKIASSNGATPLPEWITAEFLVQEAKIGGGSNAMHASRRPRGGFSPVEQSDDDPEDGNSVGRPANKAEDHGGWHGLASALRKPPLRRWFPALLGLWFSASLVYYGVYIDEEFLAGHHYHQSAVADGPPQQQQLTVQNNSIGQQPQFIARQADRPEDPPRRPDRFLSSLELLSSSLLASRTQRNDLQQQKQQQYHSRRRRRRRLEQAVVANQQPMYGLIGRTKQPQHGDPSSHAVPNTMLSWLLRRQGSREDPTTTERVEEKPGRAAGNHREVRRDSMGQPDNDRVDHTKSLIFLMADPADPIGAQKSPTGDISSPVRQLIADPALVEDLPAAVSIVGAAHDAEWGTGQDRSFMRAPQETPYTPHVSKDIAQTDNDISTFVASAAAQTIDPDSVESSSPGEPRSPQHPSPAAEEKDTSPNAAELETMAAAAAQIHGQHGGGAETWGEESRSSKHGGSDINGTQPIVDPFGAQQRAPRHGMWSHFDPEDPDAEFWRRSRFMARTTFFACLLEIPMGCVSVGLAGVRFCGRRGVIVGSSFIAGTLCLIAFCIMRTAPWWIAALVNVARLFTSGAFLLLYVFSSELLPTTIRSTVIGFCSMGARIAGISAPCLVRLLHVMSPGSQLIVFGLVSVIAAAWAAAWLPETLGRKMVDSVSALTERGNAKLGPETAPSSGPTTSSLTGEPETAALNIADETEPRYAVK